MHDALENSKHVGHFTMAPGRQVLGELHLCGAKSSLRLHDKVEFDTLAVPIDYIGGTLQDGRKVSLIDCITLSETRSGGPPDEWYYVDVFPHFVILGNSHLGPSDEAVTQAHLVTDDGTTIFYDFDAFGSVLDASRFIEQIANANENVTKRRVQTGPHSRILYFSGKTEICAVDTILGHFSAAHAPSGNLGGPGGVWLRNTVTVSIGSEPPIRFRECIDRASILLQYLGLLVGRPQNLLSLRLRTRGSSEGGDLLQAYWCMRAKRNAEHEGPKPHPAEVLLDPVRRHEEFRTVLEGWLARHHSWSDARSRFFNSFASQIHYNIDRLVGSANMFDILPDSAVPPDVALSDELKSAKDAGQKLFGALPNSQERNSILGALGRLGQVSLKQKIRHRAKQIVDAMGGRLNEIALVTDEAVNCRNHYVHGTEARLDYTQDRTLEFLTDALEFVFAASDLIESGWDINRWAANGSTMAHPFGRFLVAYRSNLDQLKSNLGSEATKYPSHGP
jgi:hypothetical protein